MRGRDKLATSWQELTAEEKVCLCLLPAGIQFERCIYYGFPEHRSDPSISQSHILAGKRDGVTRELEKWSVLIGSDTFCPIEGSNRCSGKP